MILIAHILIGVGLIFQTFGVLALYRFPDVYTRLHGATLTTTFGSIFLYSGLFLYAVLFFNPIDTVLFSFHIFLIMLFILITGPTGAHAIARASYRSGMMPQRAIVDKLKEDRK